MIPNSIYCGDNVEILNSFTDNCVDLTVTSPPYDNLRDYNGYSFDFDSLAKELFRVTKQGGIVVWVVNDKTIKGSESGTSFKQALRFIDIGFRLHDTMIYRKKGMRYPDKKRYSSSFEYMFILSKGSPKTVNLIKDKPNKWAGESSWGKGSRRLSDGTLLKERAKRVVKEMGVRQNVWDLDPGFMKSTADVIAFNHPAIFPEQLANDHILSWSNPGDTVLDPFIGSGTTAKMALKNNRIFVGIDISGAYCDIVMQRILGEWRIHDGGISTLCL